MTLASCVSCYASSFPKNLSKVPLLSGGPDKDRSAGRQPPFLFSKGPDSAAVVEAQQKLCCPIAGAVYVKRLMTKVRGSDAAAQPKKRPRVPDLTGDAAPKKAARAKGKAKAKPKAKAKAPADMLEPETGRHAGRC